MPSGRFTGEVRWLGGFGPLVEGLATEPRYGLVTDYGSIGVDGGEETVLFFKDDVGPLWGELRPGRRVSFAIDWRRGEPFAIQLKLLPSIYAYMGALTSPRWWVRLVAERPHSEVLGLLDKLLARLPNGCGNDAILKALPPELVFAPAARGMRNALPKASLALLAGRRLLRSETSLEERSAFRDAMNELQPRDRPAMWRKLEPEMMPDHALWRMAPADVRQRVFVREFGSFESLESLEGIRNAPPSSVQEACSVAYGALTDDDRALAECWLNGLTREAGSRYDYEKAKMLSARAAELVVAEFYRSLGHDVVDVSITQVRGGEPAGEWWRCDLELDGRTLVDVKNARSPVNNRRGYVEHAVPAFKQARDGADVVIAGVFSPYLTLGAMEAAANGSFAFGSVCFLGEARRTDIEQLEREYQSEYLELSVVDRNGGRLSYVPAWMFDLPERAYAWRVELRERLAALPALPWDTIKLAGVNPLPAYLAAGLRFPDAWSETMPGWQRYLFDRILPADGARATLPRVVLSALDLFLHSLSVPSDDGYSPGACLEVLSFGESGWPAGCYDPLGVVEGLCSSLQTLWESRQSAGLDGYRLFRFRAKGLLEAKRTAGDHWETILAYCGGWIEGVGKCGASPLVVGEHETCPVCRKLVCDREGCGYCSEGCPAHGERIGDAQRRREARQGAAVPFARR